MGNSEDKVHVTALECNFIFNSAYHKRLSFFHLMRLRLFWLLLNLVVLEFIKVNFIPGKKKLKNEYSIIGVVRKQLIHFMRQANQ